MTHGDAAKLQRCIKRMALAISLGLSVQGLSGCESGSVLGLDSSVLDLGDGSTGSTSSSTTASASPVVESKAAPIAFAPLIGAPPSVSKQLSGAVVSEAQRRSIPVVKGKKSKPDYTVRGYLVASPETKGTKLSYIWDVTDTSGNRTHRIKGEELVSGKKGNDPWAVVDTKAINSIAAKTATRIAKWLPKKKVVVPNTSSGNKTSSTTSKGSNQKRVASLSSKSKRSGALSAIVPSVDGAPGDGRKSLARALKKELSRNGVKLASNATNDAYKVVGVVKMGKPKSGRQSIDIKWRVLDPEGRDLGVVSQNNSIQQGSLDGSWGKTADAAAAAAAKGILELLKPKQQRKATN